MTENKRQHIRLIQCLCPKRHAIMAVLYDAETISAEDALEGFRGIVELAVSSGVIHRRCDICRSETVFHYEDARTRFQTMEEARLHGAVAEAAQLQSRLQLDAEKN